MITVPSLELNLDESGNLDELYANYARFREAPVFFIESMNQYLIGRHSDVVYALKRADLFGSGSAFISRPDWMQQECKRNWYILAQDDPDHDRHRKLINKEFVGKVINAYKPFLQEKISSLVETAGQRKSVDFVNEFAFPYVGPLINRIVGTEKTDWKRLREDLATRERIGVEEPPLEEKKLIEDVLLRQTKDFDELIEARRRNPKNDLVTFLAHVSVDGQPLSRIDLLSAIDMLFGAGFETTAQTLSHAMIYLSQQPELHSQLRRDKSLIPAFVEELLRISGPSHFLPRKTSAPADIQGSIIPANAQVLVGLGTANHDPTVFPEPEKFILNRKNIKQHVAFGHGLHICIGAALARLELKIALEHLVDFSRIECPPDGIVWSRTIITYSIKELTVSFQ